jgi:uncharacterized iron-regulated protein
MSFAVRETLILLLVLTPLLGACGGPLATANPELPYPPPRPAALGDILHIPTGTLVSEAQMLQAATDARIVYVGETHDNPASHRLELQVLEAMAERHPSRVALGMEMFTPGQQPALDRWVAGELSEKEFLRAARWYEHWRMDFDYYRELLLFARRHRIPVIGLNAEKSLVRAVGRNSPEDLSAEERARLPQMDLSDPYQRALVQSIYGAHDKGNSHLEGFLRVQTLWEETMAANVARYLASPQGEEMRLVVLAGGNHIRFGFGIPRRVFRRLPTSYTLIGSREIVIAEKKEERLMDVKIPPFPMPPYDFLVFTAYEDLNKPEVRLGVMLEEEDGRVMVKMVLPGSVAEKAGIRMGDVVVAFDGEPARDSFDVVYAVGQKKPGDRASLLIERDGEEQALEAVFEAPAAPSGD